MVVIRTDNKHVQYSVHRLYDLSFMYSKHCDLSCSFCMYSSGPQVHDKLDLNRFHGWMKGVRWDRINAIGIYGGEPSLFLPENADILEHCNSRVPKFIITNGTWSKNLIDTTNFMIWCQKHYVQCFVSGTDQHVPFQDREVLENLARDYPKTIQLKKPDTSILPMGNLLGAPVRCTVKCMTSKYIAPARIAIQPDGSIIFQTCNGVYPVIGSMDDSFDEIDRKVSRYLNEGFSEVCPHYEDACRRKISTQKSTK